MKEKGIKQSWAAEKLGLTYRQFNAYANNHVQPSIQMLYQIAELLSVTPETLLFDSDKVPTANGYNL